MCFQLFHYAIGKRVVAAKQSNWAYVSFFMRPTK